MDYSNIHLVPVPKQATLKITALYKALTHKYFMKICSWEIR